MNAPRNLRLLVVDDNPSIHADFKKILLPASRAVPDSLSASESLLFGDRHKSSALLPFEVASAFQGREALDLTRAAIDAHLPFALAFVDVRMPPGWDGVETAQRLWSVDPDLQIVICTAYSDYMWDEIADRLGRSDNLLILKKPFDNVEVLQLAHALTRKWHLTRQAQLRVDELDRLVAERTSALRASEERLRQAQKMEAIGQLAAGVAHDFNNILTVIQGHASLQLARNIADSDLRDSMQQMGAAAERAAALTRQLLAFSRKQVMHRGPIDLNQLVARLSKMLRRLIGEHIDLAIDPTENLPLVRGDVSNLEQVVLNLVVNARDAMPRGGRITLATHPVDVPPEAAAANPEAAVGPHIRFTVSDTGTGMDPATLARIFEPFFTTKEPGVGTGMGLATVHGVVRQHGGWIEVASQPGIGTTFSVFLPVTLEEAVREREEVELLIPPGNRRTVLLVEDEAPVRCMVRDVLDRHGYRVLEAAHPAEALELWSEHRDAVTLLFTDLVMPGGISGGELASRLRKDRPELRVIYTSGYGEDPPTESTAAQYLAKPYRASALAAALRNALGD